MAEIANRLREDAGCLRKMMAQAGFAGSETGVRVKKPEMLLSVLDEAADALDAAHKRIAELSGGWQPIETAPDLDRVIVAGWQPPNGNVAGYWWMHEDDIIDGVPDEHPTALLWHPFPERPALPAPPSLIDKEDRNG